MSKKNAPIGVSKHIFVDKVVVGRGVWLHVKMIGFKSQYAVFTVKISHFSQGTWFIRSQRLGVLSVALPKFSGGCAP